MTTEEEDKGPAPFELSGGALCLDFANTWGNQADRGTDQLTSYADLTRFARQTGMLEETEIAALSKTAGERSDEAATALKTARELRRLIYTIFSARAGDRDVAMEDVDRINDVLGRVFSHRVLRLGDEHFHWGWTEVDGSELGAVLWPVIESAASLLTSSRVSRVRECDGTDCNWLFLDKSRSGSRRWCSMESCGNRAKARRHYRRRQKR